MNAELLVQLSRLTINWLIWEIKICSWVNQSPILMFKFQHFELCLVGPLTNLFVDTNLPLPKQDAFTKRKKEKKNLQRYNTISINGYTTKSTFHKFLFLFYLINFSLHILLKKYNFIKLKSYIINPKKDKLFANFSCNLGFGQ